MGKKSGKHAAFRTVLLVFISLVLGISVYSWNARSLVGNRLPMPFGYGVSVVLSGSMEPELSVDELVFLQTSDDYQKGDIVVYQSGDILVIHRIVEISGDTVTTKGDANNAADAPIHITAIKGKLIGSVAHVGMLVRWIKSPAGVIVLLVAAVLLLELSWRRQKQKDADDLDRIKEEIQKLKNEVAQEGERAEDEGKVQ